jgi:hypothetical protein
MNGMIVVGMHGHKAVIQGDGHNPFGPSAGKFCKFYIFDVRKPTKVERVLVWLMGWRLLCEELQQRSRLDVLKYEHGATWCSLCTYCVTGPHCELVD